MNQKHAKRRFGSPLCKGRDRYFWQYSLFPVPDFFRTREHFRCPGNILSSTYPAMAPFQLSIMPNERNAR